MNTKEKKTLLSKACDNCHKHLAKDAKKLSENMTGLGLLDNLLALVLNFGTNTEVIVEHKNCQDHRRYIGWIGSSPAKSTPSAMVSQNLGAHRLPTLKWTNQWLKHFWRLDDLGALGAFKTRREMHYPLQIASQVSISCYIETEQYFIDKKRNPGISVQIYASCFHVSCCFWNKK